MSEPLKIRSKNTWIACALTLLALAALPARAAVHYQATTTTDNPQGDDPKMVVEAWIEGEKARIEFRESGNPLAPPGAFLVTQDGGRNLFIVNPEERTFARWDIEAMLRTAGAVLEGMGGLVKIEFSDPQVEKLLDEDGGVVAGLATRHLRYRNAYSMQFRVLGMRNASQVESVVDYWVSNALTDAALGVWLRSDPPRTGNEDLDRLIGSEMGKIEGFPLKIVTVTKTTGGKKGQKETVSRSEMAVTEFDTRAPGVEPSRFQVPQGYREVQMLPTGQGEEDNPLGGLLRPRDGR
jgi:hypothetical protein